VCGHRKNMLLAITDRPVTLPMSSQRHHTLSPIIRFLLFLFRLLLLILIIFLLSLLFLLGAC